MRQIWKTHIFRLFARGMTPEQMAADGERSRIDTEVSEKLYAEYLALSLGEKLRVTLVPERVADRTHRLTDDIFDLARLDARLGGADEKTLVALLDMKRKIKERMAKEYAPSDGVPREAEPEEEIERCYEKIFGCPPPEE